MLLLIILLELLSLATGRTNDAHAIFFHILLPTFYKSLKSRERTRKASRFVKYLYLHCYADYRSWGSVRRLKWGRYIDKEVQKTSLLFGAQGQIFFFLKRQYCSRSESLNTASSRAQAQAEIGVCSLQEAVPR